MESQRIDERLAKLAGQRIDVEAQLALGRAAPERLAELGRDHHHVLAEISMLEERWLELQGELESLQASV